MEPPPSAEAEAAGLDEVLGRPASKIIKSLVARNSWSWPAMPRQAKDEPEPHLEPVQPLEVRRARALQGEPEPGPVQFSIVINYCLFLL